MWLLQGLNKAANAFLQWALGANYTASLIGIMDFPRVSPWQAAL